MINVKTYSIVYPNDIFGLTELFQKCIDGYTIERTGEDNGEYFIILTKMIERHEDEVIGYLKFWRHKRKEFYDYEL